MSTAVKARDISKKVPAFRKISSPIRANAPVNRGQFRDFDPIRTTSSESESKEAQHGWKRALDLTCIVVSLPFTLPLMILIVLWVRIVSRGPALFRQERIGQNGKRFVLYKFRSMKMNAGTSRHETYLRHLVRSDSPMIKLDLLCDSRLIPGGCVLRAAGLDELPQLLNVLRGEMSLVGPRPCLPQEYAYFSERQRERFAALPGLTGSWQVSGKNQTTFSEMNLMDIRYVREASLGLDLSIMMRTPAALFVQMCQAFQQGRSARQTASDRESAHKPAPGCGSRRLS
jgi:lipopolysaccharide/colanic/teichoic acid biosynthesis glycosyltransferase